MLNRIELFFLFTEPVNFRHICERGMFKFLPPCVLEYSLTT